MKAKKPLLIVVVVGAAFAWGAFSAHGDVFPFPQVKSVWASVRGAFSEEPEFRPLGNWGDVRVRELPDNLRQINII